MKYLMLIYSSQATWDVLSAAERRQMHIDHAALYAELTESGEWVGGHALADPKLGKAVRVRDGHTFTTDGPYSEAKEHLAGYDLVECDSLQRALDIAARIPDARVCGVEIRPVMAPTGLEM